MLRHLAIVSYRGLILTMSAVVQALQFCDNECTCSVWKPYCISATLGATSVAHVRIIVVYYITRYSLLIIHLVLEFTFTL